MLIAQAAHPSARFAPHVRLSTVRWQRNVPEAIRAHDTLDRAHYTDIVTATVNGGPGRTPEQWIGTMLAAVPRGLLTLVPFVQRVALGLRLQRGPSPNHLLGWKIAEHGENWLRLEAASWFLTGHVVVHIDEDQLSLATFVHYDRPFAALIWPPVSLIHRRVALALMRGAARAQ